MPVLSVSDKVVSEGDRFFDMVVKLDAAASQTVSVSYITRDYTTRVGQYNDYYGIGGTLTFAPGESSKVVRVELIDDGYEETLERLTFGLSAPTNATLAGEGYAWVTIVDNDAVRDTPSIYIGDCAIDEQAGVARFAVTLGRVQGESSRGTVSVDYRTRDGSAEAGTDYLAQSGKLTFSPGESVKTIEVALLNDTLAEGLERYTLELSNATGASIAKSSGTAEIAANDSPAAPQPAFIVDNAVVGEGDGFIDVEVRLSAPGTNVVSVKYTTGDYTTRVGQYNDYYGLSGTLTFAPGETSKVVRVELIDDDYQETLERLTFGLSAPTNATLAGEGYAWVTIVDNDAVRNTPGIYIDDSVVDEQAGVARFAVSLGRVQGESSRGTVSVDFSTRDGSAEAGIDYLAQSGKLTFAPGESVKTVEVPLLNDTRAEGTERFTLELSNAASATIAKSSGTVEIAANDSSSVPQPTVFVDDAVIGEGNGFVDVEVRLSAPGTNVVSVKYTTGDYTTRVGQYNDYYGLSGTLTFAPGETSKVVRVELIDDGYEEPVERLTFGLSAPSNATLGGQGYAWITIIDNDSVRNTPSIYISDTVVNEQEGEAHFQVRLGRTLGESSLGTVSVDYRTVDETAQAGSDYVARSGRLVFAPGESVKTVTVDLIDDRLTEPGERFDLVLSNPSTGTLVDGFGSAEIVPSDPVTLRQPSIAGVASATAESDGMLRFFVALSDASTEIVTVQYATSSFTAGSQDFVSLSGTLRFEPGERFKTIAVELVTDSTIEQQETLRLNLSGPNNATLLTPSISATITDDDTPGLVVMSRGISNDVYVVTSQSTVLLEDSFGGTDTVVASLSYTLPENIDNLSLAVGSAITGTGNAGDNQFRGNASNNRFDGLGGVDTVHFQGPAAAYTVSGMVASRTVSGSEGVDTLLSIERLHFSDVMLASDTSPDGYTYQTYALYNAGFDRAPSMAELSRWTAQRDLMGSMESLAQSMINHYAPGVSNEALVAHLWGTIVETPISAADLQAFVGQLQNGTYTQASLLELAANHPLNTVELSGVVNQTLSLDPTWFPVPGW